MAKKEPDLVPYYRPGTTEPEMVPRGSVPGLPEVGSTPETAEDISGAVEEEKPKAAKKAAARKK